MDVNFNVNECPPSGTTTPGSFNVRVFYLNLQDSGHLYGVFTCREMAERCLLVLAARSDVENAVIENAT